MERGCHSLWKMISVWFWKTLNWALKMKWKEVLTPRPYLNRIATGASVFKAIEALIMLGQRGLPPSFALMSGVAIVLLARDNPRRLGMNWELTVVDQGPNLSPSVAMTMSEPMEKCFKMLLGVGVIDAWVKDLVLKHRDFIFYHN